MRESLFLGILGNDDPHPDARLPTSINWYAPQQILESCFNLSLSLWSNETDLSRLKDINDHILKNSFVDAKDEEDFKHIRARYKHLRFAFALFDERHRYPVLLNATTNFMGHLQDALSNRHSSKIKRESFFLKMALKKYPFSIILREVSSFKITQENSFVEYIDKQFSIIKKYSSLKELTPHEFHNSRKAVSRIRAYFVTINTTSPSPDNAEICNYLANLNGIMGNYHDELIENRLNGTQNYYMDKLTIPGNIRILMETLMTSHGKSY